MPGIGNDSRAYLALYEIEGDTPELLANFAKSLTQAIEAGKVDISPAMEMTNMSASFLRPIRFLRVSGLGTVKNRNIFYLCLALSCTRNMPKPPAQPHSISPLGATSTRPPMML